MSNSLQQLQTLSTVSADTADYKNIKPGTALEATTNPSIILQAATSPQYRKIVERSIEYGIKSAITPDVVIENAMDMIIVLFGKEILKVVSDKVHVQIDPRLAFNTEKSVTRALKLVRLFKENDISVKNIVIKLPATWEGIQAAKILENNHGVSCNMTTMFSMVQAATCAEASVSYLAPFVGRIGLWYEAKSSPPDTFDHPGVKILKQIQSYMKKFGYKTKVMGAYFINNDEVKAVAGCDAVTLPVPLIEELSSTNDNIKKMMINNFPENKIVLTESQFRWLMNEDEMATELLAEVIRKFSEDYVRLETIVKKLVSNKTIKM